MRRGALAAALAEQRDSVAARVAPNPDMFFEGEHRHLQLLERADPAPRVGG
jgi:hypothetical protein